MSLVSGEDFTSSATGSNAAVVTPISTGEFSRWPPRAPVPGVLHHVSDHFNVLTDGRQPDWAEMCALAVGSVVCARHYCTEWTLPNFTSLAFAAIGGTGTGKESVTRTISAHLEAADQQRLLGGSGWTSPGAMFSQLLWSSSSITQIDEFGQYLGSSRDKGNSARGQAVTLFMQAFGRLDGVLMPEHYSTMSGQKVDDMDERCIYCPGLTAVFTGTPIEYYAALSERDVANGFLNRILVVEGKPERLGLSFDAQRPEPNPEVVNWIREMRKPAAGELAAVRPTPRRIPFSDTAKEAFVDYANDLGADGNELDELLSREVEIAMRISLILALSRGASEISGEDASWSKSFCRRHMKRMVLGVKRNIGKGRIDDLEERVLGRLENAKGGELSQRDLYRGPLCRASTSERRAVKENLLAKEYITVSGKKAQNGKQQYSWKLVSGSADSADS